jgi:hypothetical protein
MAFNAQLGEHFRTALLTPRSCSLDKRTPITSFFLPRTPRSGFTVPTSFAFHANFPELYVADKRNR